MKTSPSPALAAFLTNSPVAPTKCIINELYTITLQNGAILRFTNYQNPLTVGGHVFTPFNISRTSLSSGVGTDVDSIDIDLSPLATDQVNMEPILETIQQGFWDAAAVFIQRLYMPTPGDVATLGTLTLFSGTIGEFKTVGRTKASFSVDSYFSLFNLQMPKNLFSPGCRHLLYDVGCTLLKASFTASGTVGVGGNTILFPTNLTQPGPTSPPSAAPSLSFSTPSSGTNLPAITYYAVQTYISANGESGVGPESFLAVPANSVLHVASPASASGVTAWNSYVGIGPGNETFQQQLFIGSNWIESGAGIQQASYPPANNTSGYFTLGVITFLTGINAGVSRVVEQYFSNGSVQVHPAFPVAPSSGDTFTITAGCDKQASTCITKFSNLIHFGGFPYIPNPESII